MKTLLALVISLICLCGCNSPRSQYESQFEHTNVPFIRKVCVEGHVYYSYGSHGLTPKLDNDGKPCPCGGTGER